MKFGVQIENHAGFSYDAVQKIALEAERLGFDGLFICDHWQGRTEELAQQPCLDPWVTLSALASVTRHIRLGTLVTAVGFRYPSILAKMAATLDSISGGRLQLSMGAGWYEPEYDAYGIPFPPVRVRMQQLREALQIVRLMWTQEKPSFSGAHFQVKDAYCYPRPVQKPHPKVWVGGAGEKTLLRIVAELADGWNAIALSPEEYEHKVKVLEKHCAAVGRDPSTVERSYYAPALAGKNEAAFLEVFQRFYGPMRKERESAESFSHRIRSSRPLVGTLREVTEKLERFAQLGVNYAIFYFPDKDELQQMRMFAGRVLPVFQK